MQANDNEDANAGKKTFVILTCDGGGVRALLQLMFLEQLAKDVGSPITKFIDSTTLCSGGAISGLSLIARKDNSSFKPRFTEEEATNTFYKNCSLIFPQEKEGRLSRIFNKVAPPSVRSLVNFVKMLWKIRKYNGIYSSTNQQKVIYDQFGDLKAKDTLVPFFIPTTDFQTGNPIWFTNLKGIENSHMSQESHRPQGERIYYVPEMNLADVLLSSIRPPILFDLKSSTIKYKEKDEHGVYQDKSLDIIGTDGALYAASPENYAYGLALHWLENIKKMKRDEYRIVLLSVGTGRRLINNSVERIQDLDPITQMRTTVELATVLPYRAGQGMLRSRMDGNGDIYLRIDANMDIRDPKSPVTSLSDASPTNIAKFRDFVANHFVNGANKKEYDFAVRLFQRLSNKENIEDLVEERLGERYWPLRQKFAMTAVKPPEEKNIFKRLLSSFLGENPSSANQDDEKQNPPLLRRNGSDNNPRP